ncbi:MAG: hypothetical protein KIS94_07625 [Chitinophagales bacterium]|nr:hypothetical protein [Chitinophagales bacterium]
MKKIVFAVMAFMMLGSISVTAQDTYEVQQRVYHNALKNYDLQAATIALYNMIAIKPEKADLNDSLALLYFAGERYAQAYLVGEQILKSNPNRSDILELVAVSKQNLGMIKESLSDYEKLYAAEKSLYYLYQMATLQYQLKRYGECVASLDQIINNPESAKQKVNIVVQGGSQDVPMRAAAFNVKGICAMELNQEEAAKDNFKKALEIFPEFVLAKGNLDLVTKKQDAQTKTPATSVKTTTAPTK